MFSLFEKVSDRNVMAGGVKVNPSQDSVISIKLSFKLSSGCFSLPLAIKSEFYKYSY